MMNSLDNCAAQTNPQGFRKEAWGTGGKQREEENETLVGLKKSVNELTRSLELLKEEFASFNNINHTHS